jgi:oligopeptide transport system substrate-binding protein
LPGELAQSQLFEQVVQVLRSLAAVRPLLLTLDDLQWADSASIRLLFHLGRELAGARILVLGAYRLEEVAIGRASTSSARGPREIERHPLEKVLAELKRQYGNVWLDLKHAQELEGQNFVDAIVDSEPNRLAEDFRRTLFHRTGGHPLFTVELIQAMQERGDLVQDEEGFWVDGPSLDWGALPARVEGVIEERIGRLEEELREILTVASVEGEAFTAQVVARVGEIQERKLLRRLSQELEGRHRLVQEQEETRVGEQHFSHYRFAHALFQRYLYNALSASERRLLHREVGGALEALYGEDGDAITPQLAHHFDEAGMQEKAIPYLLSMGDRARLAYAHEEAIGHYRRALALQKDTGEYDRAARTLMKLGLTHHNAFQYQRARQVYNEGFALWRRAGAAMPAASPPAPQPLKLITVGTSTLDPVLAQSNHTIMVVSQLFSGLVELTPEMEVVPDVAQTWEISADGCQYLFHLRDDVHWSDGVPVTAGDFEYAWKRALDPGTRAPSANFLYVIKGARAYHQGETRDPDVVRVQAPDADTLLVELEGPTGYFLQLLGHCLTYPVPQHVVEARGPDWTKFRHIVTNGPFRLEGGQAGESMVLSRDPAYHGRFAGNLGRVELSFLPAPNTSVELQLYATDSLDILEIIDQSPSGLDLARQRHPGEYVSLPTLSTFYVGFDVTRPPFDDLRIRRAFALATDRERWSLETWGGCFPATGGLVPPGMPGHSAGVALPYDPEQARQLLADAGYTGGRGFDKVEVLWPKPIQSQGDWLQAHWHAGLGVEIPWQMADIPTWLDKLEKETPPIFCGAWYADYPDPDNFLRASNFRPRTHWQNATYQRLVEEARRVPEQEGRMSLYRQADLILVEQAPIIPLIYRRHDVLVKPWVTQFPVSPMSWYFWKDVIIEPH